MALKGFKVEPSKNPEYKYCLVGPEGGKRRLFNKISDVLGETIPDYINDWRFTQRLLREMMKSGEPIGQEICDRWIKWREAHPITDETLRPPSTSSGGARSEAQGAKGKKEE
jgi:hypothetical protein